MYTCICTWTDLDPLLFSSQHTLFRRTDNDEDQRPDQTTNLPLSRGRRFRTPRHSSPPSILRRHGNRSRRTIFTSRIRHQEPIASRVQIPPVLLSNKVGRLFLPPLHSPHEPPTHPTRGPLRWQCLVFSGPRGCVNRPDYLRLRETLHAAVWLLIVRQAGSIAAVGSRRAVESWLPLTLASLK
jgi:hypothetical protein